MSPFMKIMQLFGMMTVTVLGMLVLLLVTPDVEDSLLRAIGRYQRRHALSHSAIGQPDLSSPEVSNLELMDTNIRAGPALDHGRRAFSPWPFSGECSHFRVHFARPRSLPMTALVSFPGSGNTWLRYLIETASGVFTGSVYTDRQIISKGFYGEAVSPDCGCTSVQKTHGFSVAGLVPLAAGQRAAEVRVFRGRGILLLRNPYEALISYRNFLYGGHTGFAPRSRFQGPEWERFASQLALVWRELAATWANYTHADEATLLHFERLRLEPSGELRRVLRFLRLAVDERRLACVLRHADGPFRRPPASPQHALFSARDPFSKKLHTILDQVIHDLDRTIDKRGWGRIPTHLYKFYTGNLHHNVSEVH